MMPSRHSMLCTSMLPSQLLVMMMMMVTVSVLLHFASSESAGWQPALIGIGATKCGTTTLFEYIRKYTYLQPGKKKELHYFDRRPYPRLTLQNKTISNNGEYEAMFPKKDTHSSYFEFTADYHYYRHTATSMWQYLPSPRSVTLAMQVRDPVSRSLSGWMEKTLGRGTVPQYRKAVETELGILEKCYNTSLALIDIHSGKWVCKSVPDQIRRFRECVTSLSADKLWFRLHWVEDHNGDPVRLAYRDQSQRTSGTVLQGIYVDQIINYICAGFHPEQFVITTRTEMSQAPSRVLSRIITHINKQNTTVDADIERQQKLSRTKGHSIPPDLIVRLCNLYRPYNTAFLVLMEKLKFDVDLSALRSEFSPCIETETAK